MVSLLYSKYVREYMKMCFTVPPNIDLLAEYFVPENDDITINCSATGSPPPSLQWTRNGTRLSDERFTIINIPCSSDCLVDARVTSSLMITNASMSDIDMYTCTAMNILGKVDASLQLMVQCKCTYTTSLLYNIFNLKVSVLAIHQIIMSLACT